MHIYITHHLQQRVIRGPDSVIGIRSQENERT